jgi:hypothetical protein
MSVAEETKKKERCLQHCGGRGGGRRYSSHRVATPAKILNLAGFHFTVSDHHPAFSVSRPLRLVPGPLFANLEKGFGRIRSRVFV